MKIDFWRALGVGSASILAFLVIGVPVYGAAPSLAVGDWIMLPVSAAVLAIFSYLYFRDSAVAPSLETGFYLAGVMFVYNLVTTIAAGMLYAAQGIEIPALPEMHPGVLVLGFVIGIATPAVVGWYLRRNAHTH